MRLDLSTLVLAGLALVFAVIAYVKDPSLPLIGARNGLSMLLRAATADPGAAAGGAVPGRRAAGNRLALLRPRGGTEGPRDGDGGRRHHARRADGQRAVSRGAGALGRRPARAGHLHDRVVALRAAAHHRLGGAAHGLEVRLGARHPEPRLPRRRRLAGRDLSSRVGRWPSATCASSSRTSSVAAACAACPRPSRATSRSRRSSTAWRR